MTQVEQIKSEIERRRVKYKELISKSFGVEQEYFKGMAVVADEMMLFINSLPEQPSEDLEKASYHAAMELMNNPNFTPKTILGQFISMLQGLFKDGANWQKEQDEAVIERAEDHAKLAGIALGEKEAKEKFINKACEWLRYCIDVDDEVKMIDGEPEAKSFIQKNLHRIKVANQLVEDFKKAMEQ